MSAMPGWSNAISAPSLMKPWREAGPPDPDELERAKAKLKARIRHQVAQALAGEDQP